MTKANNFLFFIAQNYSFEILRPLQNYIREQGGNVMWFAYGNEVTVSHFKPDEVYTQDPQRAVDFFPLATYVPGNIVPSFIPGLKVQIFHGLEWKKKGHFVIRGCFDLYCTHGPATTSTFSELAQQHDYFDVVETGWPKLDGLFTSPKYQWGEQRDVPTILFAPTFSPSLTAAPALFDEIARLSHEKDWQWLVKFHPKMDPVWIEKYRGLSSDKLKIVDDCDVSHVLQAGDIMLSDTSSIIGEFSLLGKPAVTLNNSQPGDYLINIEKAEQLENALVQALEPSSELTKAIEKYAMDLHPYSDGLNAKRVFDATQQMLTNGKQAKKEKPWNLFRNLKMRRKLSYWK